MRGLVLHLYTRGFVRRADSSTKVMDLGLEEEIFQKMDWDKDGSITLGEFKAFLKSLKNEEDVNDEELTAAFCQMDINGDRSIKWEEFVESMCRIRKQKSVLKEKEIVKLFREIDYNNDGYITPKEAIKAFKKFQERFSMHEWQIQEWIERTDYDSDGKITLEEFKLSMAGKTLVDECDSDGDLY